MFTALTYGPANAMLAVDDGDCGEQRVLGKNCTAQANTILEQKPHEAVADGKRNS